MKKLFLILNSLLLIFLMSCTDNTKSENTSNQEGSSNVKTSENKAVEKTKLDIKPKSNFHTDKKYKYEHRTGTTGNYEYNYDVEGYDEDGNSVTGNVDINGKYGSGNITDENGDEINVDVEWIDYGKLEATDDEGNTYDLEAEE